MDVVCLAAGKGTRFGRLGRYLQKCMLPVGLTPFLEYSLRNLRRALGSEAGACRLSLVIGNHGDQVRAYFGDDYDGLELRYLEQGEPRGTGHALARAAQALPAEAPVLVWLGDLYVPTELFSRVLRHPARNLLTLAPGGLDENANVRVTTTGARVTRAWHGEGPLADIGLWKLEPEVMAAMTEPTGAEVRALPNLQRQIEGGLEVGWLESDSWIHLGGTQPTAEANVLDVAKRVLALEAGSP